jgi:preprotein translocase subunit SecE
MKNTVAANADDQPERRKSSVDPAALAKTVSSWSGGTKSFLEDVRAETRRVSWPTLAQIRATTIVVIVTVFFFAAYFGVLDWFFNLVIRRVLRMGS